MNDPKMGLWANDDLHQTVAQYAGTQYYQSLPEKTHFIHSVSKILKLRMNRAPETLCRAPSVFILSAPPEGVNKASKREPTFSMGGVDVSGKVWFGSAAINSSTGISFPDTENFDAMFMFISEKLKSGSMPAILFDGATNDVILRLYPDGIDYPDVCQDIMFGGEKINKENLKHILDTVHKRSLITPSASIGSRRLWEKSRNHHPSHRAEHEIQAIVQNSLAAAIGNVRVRYENTGIYGRYDLALIEQDPSDLSKNINHAVLELKIVKAYTSSGTPHPNSANEYAVVKGLKQAYAYGEEMGSRISALCCYDMRPNPNLHKYSPKKCDLASNLDVELWAWPLYSTTEEARNALVDDHSAK